MFEELGSRISGIMSKMAGRSVIKQEDFDDAMRQMRVALLEADVPVSVITQLMASVKSEVIGKELMKQVSPLQTIIKVVHDNIVKLLGNSLEEKEDCDYDGKSVIMLIGLQGAGKTTTAAKLASRLKNKFKKKVMMVSLDVYRPAAIQQLNVLGQSCAIDTMEIKNGEAALEIAERILSCCIDYDAIVVDTAGRTNVDAIMMDELRQIKNIINPTHTIYVGDATAGQAVRKVVLEFNEAIPLTGIILTKTDSDSSSGNALAMRAVTGKHIKYVCNGEKIDNISVFSAQRMANRILGMGDIVSLVEKASENLGEGEFKNLSDKVKKEGFDMNDYAVQLNLLSRMGGLKGIMSFLPANMFKNIGGAMVDPKIVTISLALVSSMTQYERRHPDCLEESNSRKNRIASGAGCRVAELNKMLKQFSQIKQAAKHLTSMGGMKNVSITEMIKKLGV